MKRLAVLLLLTAFALAAEPLKFRGAYIGQPISDYVDCSSGKAKTQKGYRTHGHICDGSHGWIFHTHTEGGLLNPKDAGESFEAQDGKIIRIKIQVPDNDWEKVKYDLTEKLGPPASEAPDVYQNGFGARWEFNQGFWQKGEIVAYAGIKVLTVGGEPIKSPFGNQPATRGIEINVTDATHAKMPATRPNSLD